MANHQGITEVGRGGTSGLLGVKSSGFKCNGNGELLTGAARYGNSVSGAPSSRRKAYSALIYDCCGELSAS